MMTKKYTIIFIGACLLILNSSQGFSQTISKDTIAPSIINATGGSFIHNQITYEWSIGEGLITDAMQSGTIVVVNGMLQPAAPESAVRYYHIKNKWSNDEIKIYPNPSKDWVTIRFLSVETGWINMRFVDAAGRSLYSKRFYYPSGSHVERINLSHYASGNYFLDIDLEISISGQSIQKYGSYNIQKLR